MSHYDAVKGANVPTWVGEGLKAHREVHFDDAALEKLETFVGQLEFYDSFVDIRCCIEEVLSVDVRSAWQTKQARAGRFQAERSSRLGGGQEHGDSSGVCTQQIDKLLISYSVKAAENVQRKESMGSGAEDVVVVQSIELLDQKDIEMDKPS